MKLDCKHVWPYISDYIDDTVTPEERSNSIWRRVRSARRFWIRCTTSWC
jgi:hypothetical protein